MIRIPKLLENRDYRFHRSGLFVSAIGDGMQFVATSWLATTLTGKGYAAALVLIFHALPGVLFAPFAGVLADQLERRKLAAIADTFRALVLILIPILFWFGKLEVWHLYAMSFLDACGDIVSRPARSRLVREIVPAERLLEANTMSMTCLQFGLILGAMSSGFIIAAFSPVVVMVVNAISFLVAAACTLLIRLVAQAINTARESAGWRAFLQDFRLGLEYLRANPQLAFYYLIGLMLSSTAQSMNALIVPFVRNTLGLSADALGLIDGSWAAGAALAGLILSLLTKRFSRATLMVWGPVAVGLSLVFCAAANGLLWAMLGFLLMGAFTRTNVLYRTTAQEKTQLEFQGRVEGAFGTLTSLVFLLLYATMGAAQEFFSPRVLMLVFAAIIALGAVWAWWTLLARGQTAAQPTD